MGFFSMKAVCEVCGETCGLSRIQIKNKKWICMKCFKKAKLTLTSPVGTMSANEIKDLINQSNTDNRKNAETSEPLVEKCIEFPTSCFGHELVYHYEDVKIYIPEDIKLDLDHISAAERVVFECETSNKYDEKAVAVTLNREKIGYLFKGKIKDMVNDFRRDEYPISSFIQSVDYDTGEISVAIAFYRTIKSAKKSDVQSFKLVANKGQEMQDEIAMCTEGEDVCYEYDYEKEKYLATASGDIGYFPKSANELLESNPDAVIESIDYDYTGKFVVTVSVSQ